MTDQKYLVSGALEAGTNGMGAEEVEACFAIARSEGVTFTQHSRESLWKFNTNGKVHGVPKRCSGFNFLSKEHALRGYMLWRRTRGKCEWA